MPTSEARAERGDAAAAMGADELRAYEALAALPRLAELCSLARSVVGAAADARKHEWRDPARVRALLDEHKIEKQDLTTPFGDPLAVVDRGPEDDAERSLARALWAHVVAERAPKTPEEEDRAAAELLWLAVHTPFDATTLLDRALGEEAAGLWSAMASRLRRIDRGEAGASDRGEALVAAGALACSTSSAAAKAIGSVRADVRDPVVARLLGPPTDASWSERLEGELVSPPRGPVATTLLAITGILFVAAIARVFGRVALSYARPAEVTLSPSGVRVRARTTLLGRTVADREVVIAREALVRATREVRYPRLGFYVGLLALAIGSYVGVSTAIDGVRAASPSLLCTGIAIVTLGIALDYALSLVFTGARGRCRVAFVPRRGRAVCLGAIDAREADAALAKLAR